MEGKVIDIKNYKNKKKPPIIDMQDEEDYYIDEIREQFKKLLSLDKKGSVKNERVRKKDSARIWKSFKSGF